MPCALPPSLRRASPPTAPSTRCRGRARAGEGQLATTAAPAQEAFPFLEAVPPAARSTRREERARRPHLRGRTQPSAESQLVLPFRRPEAGGLLTPERAEAMEMALVQARQHREGSPLQRAAEEQLLHLLQPFLEGEVSRALATHAGTYLSREDLLQEALLRAQKLWKGFVPGKAGPGRTLYPAYVKRAVSQHLGNVLAEAQLVPVTHWGRKLAARARRRAASGEVEYSEALGAEKADHATRLALTLGTSRVSERAAEELADESEEVREELGAQRAALASLAGLPKRQRLAVASHFGVGKRTLSDAVLARQLRCSVAEVLAARQAGLAALRAALA